MKIFLIAPEEGGMWGRRKEGRGGREWKIEEKGRKERKRMEKGDRSS